MFVDTKYVRDKVAKDLMIITNVDEHSFSVCVAILDYVYAC